MTTNTTVKLGAGSTYNAASDALIFGSTGAEIVKIFDGVTVTTDSSVERVEFSRASSEYTFKATNTGLQVSYSGKVVANVVSGEKLAFSNGSAVVASTFDATTATGAITLNGTVVPTTDGKLTALIPNNATGEASSVAQGTQTPVSGAYTIVPSTTSVTEGSAITFTVTAATAQATATTLHYQVIGSLVGTDLGVTTGDFTTLGDTVVLPANATTVTFTVTPTNDGIVEGFEGFKVALLDASYITVASSAAVVIGDGPTMLPVTLSQGLDNLPGTPKDDTFNAYAFNSLSGADVTTLNSVDSIDGAAGNDTLYIEVKDVNPATLQSANFNGTIQGNIKNIETIKIDNTAADSYSLPPIDASKFQGATFIQQIAQANDVTNLAATTTASFKDITNHVFAGAATGVTSVAVNLDNFAEGFTIGVSGNALNAVTVSGTVKDSNADKTVGQVYLEASVGLDVQSLSVNSAVALDATVYTNASSTKAFTTFNASSSTGDISYDGLSYVSGNSATSFKVNTITTGAGNDYVELVADTNAGSGSTAAVGASASTGAGDDSIEVNTKSINLSVVTGTTSVDAGEGNDTVVISTRSDGKLTVNLGGGTDSLTSAVPILATDSIDAGAGSDTLLLKLVGSSNVGAFSNFDVFDVKGLANNLDLDILTAKNTVGEIVGSDALGAVSASLLNVGSGVNFRAIADMGSANTLTLTQKTAGALTVTLDADETGTGNVTADANTTKVIASNATSLKAVFDTSYLASITSEPTPLATDNVSTITLFGAAATSLEVVSGGALSKNVLSYTDSAAAPGKLASLSITGANDLRLDTTTTVALATVDASAFTGGLTFSLAYLKDTGTLKLGTGTDLITVTSASIGAAGFESIQNFEKTPAVSVVSPVVDATGKAAAIAAADKIVFSATVVATDVATIATLTGGSISKGVLTFAGTGPSNLTDAIAIADTGAVSGAVAFQYVGNSYLYDGSNNSLVQLTGITGVTNLGYDATVGVAGFFIV
jgi:hypothetical protein